LGGNKKPPGKRLFEKRFSEKKRKEKSKTLGITPLDPFGSPNPQI